MFKLDGLPVPRAGGGLVRVISATFENLASDGGGIMDVCVGCGPKDESTLPEECSSMDYLLFFPCCSD